MPSTIPRPRLVSCRTGPHRHLTLHGSREDALEHLPGLDEPERLELAASRISLVGDGVRVDVRILVETGGRAAPHEAVLTLLELAFEGRSELEADDFVRRYRQGGRLASARARGAGGRRRPPSGSGRAACSSR